MTNTQRAIRDAARQYAGLTEISPNQLWDDLKTKGPDARAAKLKKSLVAAGHLGKNAYCMTFCKAVYMEVFPEGTEARKLISKMLNPGVVPSYNNCKKNKYITTEPQIGAIYFMQKGSTGMGHAGLVMEDLGGSMLVCDGNTSPAPTSAEADRNGDGVYEKKRPAIITEPKSGLWLMGFFDIEKLM